MRILVHCVAVLAATRAAAQSPHTGATVVVPASGALYTLEGMDWGWSMGIL